ncbi:MAG TPA: DUF1353 domain-containing protein [Bryobacteraceae bacterium]|nr:DUF1353 domain-containing protein [Bryobacteraceae bacterium]
MRTNRRFRRLLRRTSAALVLLSSITCLSAAPRGTFIGLPVTASWNDDRRTMTLVSALVYIDPNGMKWEAPAGSIVDGASIPKIAWSLIGGPYEGAYREPSVIHDVACRQKTRPWELVHLAFYYAMLDSNVNPTLAKVMYAAVYHFGPRWPYAVQRTGLSRKQAAKARSRQSDASLTLKVEPPPRRLSEPDFDKLKAQIEQRDASGTPMSLEEIRNMTAPE